jgi:hypothetical protein
MKYQKGQLLIVVAIVISIAMLLLAVAVDGGRLFLERSRIARAGQSAADAGVGVAAEEMVDLAEERRAEAITEFEEAVEEARRVWEEACLGEALPEPPPEIDCDEEFDPEPFEPCEPEPQCWLEAEDWATLDSEGVRSQVVQEALEYARANGYDLSDSSILSLDVEYVVDQPEESLQVQVTIRRRTTILLIGLLGGSFVNLEADGLSKLLN